MSKPLKVGMCKIHILNRGRCVNSKWIASWIAKKNQEHCECGFKCKIRVIIQQESDYQYEYVIDKKELYRLLTLPSGDKT